MLLLIIVFGSCDAQTIGLKVSNNVTAYPFTGIPQLVVSKLHPGIDLTCKKIFQQKNKYAYAWEGNLGYMYHRFFQQAIRINGTIICQRTVGYNSHIYAGLGGGYWHSIRQYDRFELNSDGVYEKIIKLGRPQFSAHLALGMGKKVVINEQDKYTLRIEYRGLIHGVLAKSYVPIVPYNILSIGLEVPISNLKKDSK